METSGKKISLFKMVLFTVCGIIVLDTFVAPAQIGVSSITIWLITAIFFFIPLWPDKRRVRQHLSRRRRDFLLGKAGLWGLKRHDGGLVLLD